MCVPVGGDAEAGVWLCVRVCACVRTLASFAVDGGEVLPSEYAAQLGFPNGSWVQPLSSP